MPLFFDRDIRIPSALHEVLGRNQSLGGLASIALVTVLAGLIWALTALPEVSDLAVWRQLLAALLMLDIAAGAVANFTLGTNRFYSERPAWRWGFIALHVHLPAVGLLLDLPIAPLLLVWVYTLVGACLVNLCFARPWQPVVAGALLCIGLLGVPLLSLSPWLTALSLLFMTKVLYAFSVNHYRFGVEHS